MIATGKMDVLGVESDEMENDYELLQQDGWMGINEIARSLGWKGAGTQLRQKLKNMEKCDYIDATKAYHPIGRVTARLYRHRSGSMDWVEILKGKFAFANIPSDWLSANQIAAKYHTNPNTIRSKMRHHQSDSVVGIRGNEITNQEIHYYNPKHIEEIFGTGSFEKRITIQLFGDKIIVRFGRLAMTKPEWEVLKKRVDAEFEKIAARGV